MTDLLKTINPATGETLKTYPRMSDDEMALAIEQCQVGRGDAVIEGLACLFGFAQHAAHPRVGILNVIHRVVVGLRPGEVDVKGQLRVRAPCRQEEARCITAHFINQIANSDVAARAFGQFYLNA